MISALTPMPQLAAIVVGLLSAIQQQRVEEVRARSAELVSVALDREVPGELRDTALAELERVDFSKAVEIAPSLLSAENALLRVRASWVLASGGRTLGVQMLTTIASERTEESVVAIEALGRLKESATHPVLRTLMERELEHQTDAVKSARTFQLIQSLGEYSDKADAAILARAVGASPSSWVEVEALGRTGGVEAIPTLEAVFDRTGKGWTMMAAGLGLARCGSEKGLSYVRRRLADTSGDPNKPNESGATNAATDDPNGPKATEFILSHLGAPVDEVFLPELLQVLRNPAYSWRRKALAWQAVVRTNPVSRRQELLDLAWSDLSSEWAARYVVLNDEGRARSYVGNAGSTSESYERANLRRALSAASRERTRWREIHAYSF